MGAIQAAAIFTFFLVYLGMILGSWPGLALDRTGIALLGAIAFIELLGLPTEEAVRFIDLSALSILFSFMIISAQFYFSGFYTMVAAGLGRWQLQPGSLLSVIIAVSASLSAVLINDIVCLALTPLLISICMQKKLDPLPFLIALACASNIGSGITLIGNPQNLLIGQVFDIPFVQYMQLSLVPCLAGLAATWLIIGYQTKRRWHLESAERPAVQGPPFDPWQAAKGIFVIIALIAVFVLTDIPRDKASLVAAGFLLLSRRMASQTMLSFIDWQLLVLFIGLFIVNRGFLHLHDPHRLISFLENYTIDLHAPWRLASLSLLLSNLVSNVPAVMLLLPLVQNPFEGSLLALSSTIAGNLFILGSIANLIVAAQAKQCGVTVDWKRHFQTGFPVALLTFSAVLGWAYFARG